MQKAFSEVSEECEHEANLVKAAQDADANIKYHKEQQNIAQKDYDQIIRELIPAAMDSMGLESVSVDGNSITLQSICLCSYYRGEQRRMFCVSP